MLNSELKKTFKMYAMKKLRQQKFKKASYIRTTPNENIVRVKLTKYRYRKQAQK